VFISGQVRVFGASAVMIVLDNPGSKGADGVETVLLALP
jgi:hypothetical protein